MPTDSIRRALLSSEISLYKSATDTDGKRFRVVDCLRVIRDGAALASITADLRATDNSKTVTVMRRGKPVQIGAQDEAKTRLPAVTWSGAFTQRSVAGLDQHSRVVCLDLDYLPLDAVANVKEWIASSPHVLAIFISPRGAGLKILLAVEFWEGGPLDHGCAWQTCADYLHKEFGYPILAGNAKGACGIDPSGKDVCRLCFLASDPAVYIAADVVPLPVDPSLHRGVTIAANTPALSPEDQEAALRAGPLVLADITLAKAEQVLGFLTPDCPRGEWITVGLALKTQFPDDGEGAAALFDRWSSGELWKGEPIPGDFYAGNDACLAEWATFSDPKRRANPVRFRTVLAKAMATGNFRMADLAEPGEQSNARILWLKTECRKHIDLFGLCADAVKGLRLRDNPGQMLDMTVDSLARELTDQFRPQLNGILSITLVYEILDAIFTREAKARRQELMRELLGRPSNPAGREEAVRWLRAVTGTFRETDLAALGHWLWLVKRKQASMPSEHLLMPILYCVKQGPGKSTAVARLIAPWKELQIAIDETHFEDDRKAKIFAQYAIGVWDEMQGIQRADLGKLKNKITAAVTNYRPMGTNDNVDIPVMINFIGTSNKTVEDMIRDPTGARRFYQINCADSMPWDTINGINYNLLWSWVSEKEPSPMTDALRALMREKQNGDAYRDPVERWLSEETWEEYTGRSAITGMAVQIGKADEYKWMPTADLFERFSLWCESAGERRISKETLGRKLTEFNWIKSQAGAGDLRGKMGYRQPFSLDK